MEGEAGFGRTLALVVLFESSPDPVVQLRLLASRGHDDRQIDHVEPAQRALPRQSGRFARPVLRIGRYHAKGVPRTSN